jgi:hypothetical protein
LKPKVELVSHILTVMEKTGYDSDVCRVSLEFLKKFKT